MKTKSLPKCKQCGSTRVWPVQSEWTKPLRTYQPNNNTLIQEINVLCDKCGAQNQETGVTAVVKITKEILIGGNYG